MKDAVRRFFGNDAIKVLTAVSVVIGIVLGAWQIWERLFPAPEDPRLSVQYIVDVSEEMAGRIGRRQKLAAVRDEILADVRNIPNAAASLRLTGGDCSVRYVEPKVPFAEDNADDFEDALADPSPGGDSDFAQAIWHASSDLLTRSREGAATTKTLVIVIGGQDTCTKNPGPRIVGALRNLRAEESLELNFKFVGVKVPPDDRRLLRTTRRKARDLGFSAETDFPTTPPELADAIDAGGVGPADDQYGTTG